MKKIIPILILFAVSIFFWTSSKQQKQEKKTPNETFVSLLNEEKLFEKISQPEPHWMEQQLSEDFAPFEQRGISKEAVDATFAKIWSLYPDERIIRYRVVDGELYRYFPEGQLISLRDTFNERALKTLIHYFDIDDIDFIYSYIDGIPLQEMPENFYICDNQEVQAPILSPAKTGTPPYLILVPDWRSVCKWWANDIKSVLQGVQDHPWETKKDSVFWRGGFTKAIRLTLCQLTNSYPDLIDAKFHVQTEDPFYHQIIQEQGLLGEKVPLKKFLEYRYLPTLDGVCCAYPSFQWRLLSNSLTFKEDSNEVQWFYRAVDPYVHYVPVQSNLSDLVEKTNWARENETKCQELIENSTDFVLNNLMMEDIYRYFYLVLQRYSSLQKLDRKALKKEVSNNPRWVNIQRRRKLRRKIEKKSSENYTDSPIPWYAGANDKSKRSFHFFVAR